VELVARRVAQLREDLTQGVVDGARNQVTWVEIRARSAAIGASPVDLSNTLKARVFAQIPA